MWQKQVWKREKGCGGKKIETVERKRPRKIFIKEEKENKRERGREIKKIIIIIKKKKTNVNI